jgi:hypothetical protein
MNTTGNTWRIVYSAGTTTWAASPGYGTLKITVPAGFSSPSLSSTDPGYFTVSVSNGTLFSYTVNGMQILLQVRGLITGAGTITINFGDRSGGGPGAAAAANAGNFTFAVEMTPDGDITAPIDSSPSLDIVTPLGSATLSPQTAACGLGGNTAELTYIPQTLWGNGTLQITIPAGFSQPSLNSGAPGYFTVSVIGGTLTQVMTESMNIIVSASGIPNDTGRIIVDYGSRSGTGPGFTAPYAAGNYTFSVASDNDGTNIHQIASSPLFAVNPAHNKQNIYCEPDCYKNINCFKDIYADLFNDTDNNAYFYGKPDLYCNADTDGFADIQRDKNNNTHLFRHAYKDCHADENSLADFYIDTDGYGHKNCDADKNRDIHPDGDCDADFYNNTHFYPA